jgi:transcriptional regulator with XRE-family HTH domain
MTSIPLPDQLYVKRKLRGLSQAALAELAGMTTKHYQRIETGHVVPRIDTVQALADALDCELTLKAKQEER